MHIVLFFTFDISLTSWKDTGLLEREIKLYKHLLDNHEIKFTFITYGDSSDKQIQGFPKEIEIVPVYEVIKYSNVKLLRFLKSFILPFKLRKIISKADILKTNQLNGGWVPILSKIIFRNKLFIRTGYNPYSFAKRQDKSFSIKMGYFFLTQISLIFSNIFTVTSLQDKKNIQKSFLFTDKIRVRPNWINVESYPNLEDRLEDRVLSVGRLEKQKNFEMLIKSLKDSQITIDIVGDGSLRNDLITLASKYSVNLNLIGTLGNDELLKLYPKYKFFVLSSLYEGNPKVLLEAMAAGCLVLANKIESVDEIIKHEENGILFNINKLDLINIINKLGNKTEKVENMRKNAYLSVLKNNSFENSFDKELLDYKDLVFESILPSGVIRTS